MHVCATTFWTGESFILHKGSLVTFGRANIRNIHGFNFQYALVLCIYDSMCEMKNKIMIIKTCILLWHSLLLRVYFNVCLLDFVNIYGIPSKQQNWVTLPSFILEAEPLLPG